MFSLIFRHSGFENQMNKNTMCYRYIIQSPVLSLCFLGFFVSKEGKLAFPRLDIKGLLTALRT